MIKSSYNYPILKEVLNLYIENKRNIDDTYILACQHILEPQAKMFELLNSFGISKEKIHIFGKIYSTSNEVLDYLKSNDFSISEPIFNPEISFDEQHIQNCKNEFDNFLSKIKNPSKVIFLDDGGELLKTVNENFGSIPENISVVGIEQTSSGFRKLENATLNFPIFNVARSDKKLVQESPFICSLGCQRVFEVFEKYEIKNPRVLVVGLGPIGQNMLQIIADNGYYVVGYDIAQSENKSIEELIISDEINIVIGSTGTNILNSSQIDVLNKELKETLFLISMSSSDREFPASYLRENKNLDTAHGDIQKDKIVLINNGFPITFKGNAFESPPQEIELTIALLLGSALEAIVSDIQDTSFISVPEKVTDIL